MEREWTKNRLEDARKALVDVEIAAEEEHLRGLASAMRKIIIEVEEWE